MLDDLTQDADANGERSGTNRLKCASLRLGDVAGVAIRLHWTFLLLVAGVACSALMDGEGVHGVMLSVAYLGAIFTCVTLHELGHALAARAYGVPTSEIMLLPIGGAATVQEMPDDPRQELVIALAGPLVNIAIAAFIYLVAGTDVVGGAMFKPLSAGHFVHNLFSINVMLVLFNLIPAFPLDGGRVLRAALTLRSDRSKATLAAARMGNVIGVIFFLLGLFANPFLIFIGFFVFTGACYENVIVQRTEELKNREASHALTTSAYRLSGREQLADPYLLAAGDRRPHEPACKLEN